MEYKYNNKQQYKIYSFYQKDIVKAQYVKSSINDYIGNPLIEALPEPRNEKEVFKDYNKPLRDYNYNLIKTLNSYEKQLSIFKLREIRYPLLFHTTIENDFNLALINSYSQRKLFNSFGKNEIIENKEEELKTVLYGDMNASTYGNLSLIGYSGCGKSSSLEILLNRYPKAIEHNIPSKGKFIQIVYISAVCMPNTNVSSILDDLCRSVDISLRNSGLYYYELCKKQRTIGKKINFLCNLIESFSIGMIILDEIQLISFDSTKETSFEAFLNIVNKTKIALFVIGTEDSYKKMFPNMRTRRRAGVHINANLYCLNKGFVTGIIRDLCKYQWYDEYVPITDEIVNALYEVSGGVIDQLINVYIYMQLEYVRLANKPKIDSDYVYEISNRFFPGLLKQVSSSKEKLINNLAVKTIEEGKNKLEEIKQDLMQERFAEEIISNMELENKKILLNDAFKVIEVMLEISGKVYNAYSIKRALEIVLERNPDIDEKQLVKKALTHLENNYSDKRNIRKK